MICNTGSHCLFYNVLGALCAQCIDFLDKVCYNEEIGLFPANFAKLRYSGDPNLSRNEFDFCAI